MSKTYIQSQLASFELEVHQEIRNYYFINIGFYRHRMILSIALQKKVLLTIWTVVHSGRVGLILNGYAQFI